MQPNPSSLRITLLSLLAASVLLTACSKVTPDNYAKVDAGMSRDEVYAILGKPDEVSGTALGNLSMSAETWTGGGNTIHITFGGDKVALKTLDSKGSKAP